MTMQAKRLVWSKMTLLLLRGGKQDHFKCCIYFFVVLKRIFEDVRKMVGS